MTNVEHTRTILKQYRKLASVILNEFATRAEMCAMLKMLESMIASDYAVYPAAQANIALVWQLVARGINASESGKESNHALRIRLRLIIALCTREIEDTQELHGIPF